MRVTEIVTLVLLGWTLVSVVVALGIGAAAKARDGKHPSIPGRRRARRDDRIRTAL